MMSAGAGITPEAIRRTAEGHRQMARDLEAIADALEASATLPAPPMARRRRPGRTTPRATPEDRQRQSRERWALYGRYNSLRMERGDGRGKLTQHYFADTFQLNASELSRWLSPTGRGIADGTQPDVCFRRTLRDAIAELEAKVAAAPPPPPPPKPNGRGYSTIQSPLQR